MADTILLEPMAQAKATAVEKSGGSSDGGTHKKGGQQKSMALLAHHSLPADDVVEQYFGSGCTSADASASSASPNVVEAAPFRALIRYAEAAAVESANQQANGAGDDGGILVAESLFRLIATLLHSQRFAALVRTLKQEFIWVCYGLLCEG